MQWKFEGSRPVYLQIMEQVRRAVLTGEYPPGSRIPPVRELAVQANVNPNTMQRALMTLEQEQILLSFGTAGRFVTSDHGVLGQLRLEEEEKVLRGCYTQLRAMGIPMEQAAARLLALEKEELP